MLVYDNKNWLRILLQVEGGVLWGTLPWGIVSGAATLGFAVWFRSEDESWWKPVIQDTWAANLFGTAITFAIVYRTRISWARYWEAATQVHFMFSKWSDSFTQLISFIATAEKRLEATGDTSKQSQRAWRELQDLRQRLAHDFSVLSALATHRLTHGDILRMRRRSEIFESAHCYGLGRICKLWRHWDDLIVAKEDLRYHDATRAFRIPHFRVLEIHDRKLARARLQKQSCYNNDKGSSARYVSVQGSPSARSADRTTGTSDDSLATMMLTTSNVTWSSDLVILGALSPEEKTELDAAYEAGHDECTQPDRVASVMGWINEDINELLPVVGMAPPIISRCYQELSNGMLGCNQATKMADIPFPFPFLQLMELLLFFYTLLIPVYAANFTGGIFFSPFLATIVTMSFWSLTEISSELETPFADGPNQLPVIDYHERFVEALRHTAQLRRPLDKTTLTESEAEVPVVPSL